MTVRSRREFAAGLAALLAAAPVGLCRATDAALQLGLNTYSLRALPSDEALPVILDAMHRTDLHHCQLWARHVEPIRFQSPFPGPAETAAQAKERKARAEALTAWRLTVSDAYFADIRERFLARGIRIRSYSVGLGSTPAEIERQFAMARALGAEALIARVPEALTAMVAAVAGRQRMPVGLQFSDPAALERQLNASTWFRIDPDIGDLTRGGVDALQFVRQNYGRCLSVDLKDAIPGGRSVPFGQGGAQMAEVLRFLSAPNIGLTAYIDCDYEGTGQSVAEVERCVAYARRCLEP